MSTLDTTEIKIYRKMVTDFSKMDVKKNKMPKFSKWEILKFNERENVIREQVVPTVVRRFDHRRDYNVILESLTTTFPQPFDLPDCLQAWTGLEADEKKKNNHWLCESLYEK